MLPLLAARIFDAPHMIHPGIAATMLRAIGPHVLGVDIVLAGDGLDAAPSRARMGTVGNALGRAYERAGRVPFDVVEGVAIIAVEGILVHKGAYVGLDGCTGETSYQGLQTQIAAATASPMIRGIIFEVDSFGGEVAGAFETADMIARASKVKPTLSILTDQAYSAGYLLASQARQIVMPPSGGAGSIGVITLHADYSRQLDAAGVTVTIISSGEHKADGNAFGPLPEAVAGRIKATVDAMRLQFADAVGKGRGKRLTSSAALATEAQIYHGTAAVDAGLVDAIALPVDAARGFIDQLK
jgi:signal peptide peptidase SppA